MLLAVDGNQRIVGANRAARTSILLDDRRLEAGISLWTIFERDPELFRRNNSADIATRLVIAGSNDSRSALVTPPDQTFAALRNATSAALHARLRFGRSATIGADGLPCLIRLLVLELVGAGLEDGVALGEHVGGRLRDAA